MQGYGIGTLRVLAADRYTQRTLWTKSSQQSVNWTRAEVQLANMSTSFIVSSKHDRSDWMRSYLKVCISKFPPSHPTKLKVTRGILSHNEHDSIISKFKKLFRSISKISERQKHSAKDFRRWPELFRQLPTSILSFDWILSQSTPVVCFIWKNQGDLLHVRHKRCVGFDFCNGNLSHCITSYWILESLVKFGNVRKCLCAPRRMLGKPSTNSQKYLENCRSRGRGGGGGASPLDLSCILVLSSISLFKIRWRLKGSTVLDTVHMEIYQLMTCPLHLNADLRLMVSWGRSSLLVT